MYRSYELRAMVARVVEGQSCSSRRLRMAASLWAIVRQTWDILS